MTELAALLSQNTNSDFDHNNQVHLAHIRTKAKNRFLHEIEPTQDIQAAQQALSHDFRIVPEALRTVDGKAIKDHQAMVIKSDNPDNPYHDHIAGITGNRFTPQQPIEIYDPKKGLVSDILKAYPDAKITGGYTKYDGSRIGVRILLKELEPILNDIIRLSVYLETSFDSSIARKATMHSERLVCLNGMTITGLKRAWKVRNTQNGSIKVKQKNQEIFAIQDEIDASTQTFDDQLQFLVKKKMNDGEASTWFKTLLLEKSGKNKNELAQTGKTRLQTQVNEFERLLQEGNGAEYGQGTRYSAWNALTNYATHSMNTKVHKGRNEDELRFLSNLDGVSAQLSTTGFQKLLTM